MVTVNIQLWISCLSDAGDLLSGSWNPRQGELTGAPMSHKHRSRPTRFSERQEVSTCSQYVWAFVPAMYRSGLGVLHTAQHGFQQVSGQAQGD